MTGGLKRAAQNVAPSSSSANGVTSTTAKKVSLNQLDALKRFSSVVADTGDFKLIKEYKPQDSTTNPTLLFQASQLPEYRHLLDEAITSTENDLKVKVSEFLQQNEEKQDLFLTNVADHLAVNFGCEILKIVPGVVSTEVDANLSFNTKASIEKANKLIGMYKEKGVDKSRVLIKMATSWESCEAAKVLQKDNINCNMTLLFTLIQAVAAAEAGAFLISPFVGRILDWHKAHATKDAEFSGHDDPGVVSVVKIYKYYKKFHYKTIVMGASFRNKDEILCLAGCDRLTISPKLLTELKDCNTHVDQALTITMDLSDTKKIEINERNFRWLMNEDQMGTEKLSEGIRNFNLDRKKLIHFIYDTLITRKNI